MKSTKRLKSFWASWQISYTLKWEVGRRPDCLIVTWESKEVDKPKSLWRSKEYNFFLRQQKKTMGQILILCNLIGWFHCFFHVLPEGDVYCYLWESFHKRVITEDENIAPGRLMNDNHIQSPTELSDKHFGNCAPERPRHWGQEVLVIKNYWDKQYAKLIKGALKRSFGRGDK